MTNAHILIVDDNVDSASGVRVLLEGQGHEATIVTSSEEALSSIPADPPDCVLLNARMPSIDGPEICSRLKAMPELTDVKIVICASAGVEFDRRRAAEIGADGYVVTPIEEESFLETLDKVLAKDVEMVFWGIRGTLPRPGPGTVRYGGNTSCVSLEFPGGEVFVFDAVELTEDRLGNAVGEW